MFPDAPIGFFGIRRDEKTAKPLLYYENIPPISPKNQIILLDPMLATGGSATLAIRKIIEKGATEKQIIFTSIISSKEGFTRIQRQYPSLTLITASIDPKMNRKKFIVPGLGDFGDRYFSGV